MNALSGSGGVAIVVLGVIGLLAGLLGFALYLSERQRVARERTVEKPRRMPKQWPLNPRPLVNSAERRVWDWLRETFPDHQIVPKLPLTRFTMPRDPEQGREWFEMLSTAYCSFTICSPDGQVIGCVDVNGPRSLTRGNKHLKHTLLGQCGIGYWVMTSDTLPRPEALRTEFLGAGEAMMLSHRTQPAAARRIAETLPGADGLAFGRPCPGRGAPRPEFGRGCRARGARQDDPPARHHRPPAQGRAEHRRHADHL